MADTLDPLILDLVEFVAREPRTYAEVMEAWRTSCPRLTVWEDAVERGFVVRLPGSGQTAGVAVTEAGRRFLSASSRADLRQIKELRNFPAGSHGRLR